MSVSSGMFQSQSLKLAGFVCLSLLCVNCMPAALKSLDYIDARQRIDCLPVYLSGLSFSCNDINWKESSFFLRVFTHVFKQTTFRVLLNLSAISSKRQGSRSPIIGPVNSQKIQIVVVLNIFRLWSFICYILFQDKALNKLVLNGQIRAG